MRFHTIEHCNLCAMHKKAGGSEFYQNSWFGHGKGKMPACSGISSNLNAKWAMIRCR
jgi:hypothetical protein